ncbi:MAG: HVO_2922 family protein [Halobacteriales archaeon]
MTNTATFEVFRDRADEWRWRLVAPNGNIIADSGEGYRSKQGVRRGIDSVKRSAASAEIRILDDD